MTCLFKSLSCSTALTAANDNFHLRLVRSNSRASDTVRPLPLAKTETYAYEAASGRLHSITDALGQVKTFAYDIDDRIKGITYTATVNPTANVTFTWDSFFPRLKSMTDGLGTTNFAYTAVGTNGALKLSSIDGPFANDVIGLTYDTLGRLAGRTITGGNETFGYDAISRLTSHATPLGTFTSTYLGQTDQTASRSVTNGAVTVSTNWGYDTNANDRRLISIANSGVTRSYALSYLNGTTIDPYNIAGITDTAAAGHPFATQAHAYGYDLADRLLTATSTTPGNYSYGYDNLDNATSITDPGLGSISPTYNGFNQLATFPTRTYTYDNNGNTTSDGLLRNYKWDAENRLIEIDYIGTSNKTTFAYDGLGRRTVATETIGGTSSTSRFLWCPDKQGLNDSDMHDGSHQAVGGTICQTRDGSDTVLKRDFDEGEYNVATSQKLVYAQDQLGSIRDVLDATTGSLISSIDYSPYGNPIATNGAFVPLYQYAGLVYHPQSALLLSATRFYDPISDGWLSKDLIREAGGPNLYNYVGANPTKWSDSAGLYGVCPLWDKLHDMIFPPPARPISMPIPQTSSMARSDERSCSCQHRDVHTSNGQSCQVLRETGVCGGPYKGTGTDQASCQADARQNAPAACRGCLGHCQMVPGK